MASIAYNKDFIGPVCPPVHFTTPQKCLFVQAVLHGNCATVRQFNVLRLNS